MSDVTNASVHQLPAELEWLPDPYPALAELASAGPAVRVRLRSGFDGWVITRYDDVMRLAADPRLASDPAMASPELQAHPGFRFTSYEFATNSMLRSDPPDHSRLRRAVSRGFTARRTEQLRPRVQEITNAFADAMAPHGKADLVASYARPLPMAVVCELLGLPFDEREKFEDWAFRALAPISGPEGIEGQRDARDALHAYLSKLIDIKAQNPGTDLISVLATPEEGATLLSREELVSMILLLLLGGQETTANLLGSAVLALLRHPGQLAALRDDPSLIPAAVEEFVRYDGPIVLGLTRFATDDITIGDSVISAGEIVFLSTATANHDPHHFSSPDKLDIHRQNNLHAGFGHGIHFCLGAPLARLETQIGIETLLTRFPDLALAVDERELRWRPSITRGLAELPVTFTPSG